MGSYGQEIIGQAMNYETTSAKIVITMRAQVAESEAIAFCLDGLLLNTLLTRKGS
jgi:hypothetical protein